MTFFDARLPSRFWDKVMPEPNTGCWLWTAFKTSAGYGHFRFEGKPRRAHRLAYERLVAVVPDGLEIDHRCHTRECVNPAHLAPVTHRENCRRSPNIMRRHRSDRCPHGHLFDTANSMERKTRVGRECRTCIRERDRSRRARA